MAERKMKDSGVEWIGEIPVEWNIVRHKLVASVMYGYPLDSNLFSDEGFPMIRIRDITSGKIETYYIGSFPNNYIVKKGDVLLGMDGDFNLRVWNDNDAVLNQRCCSLLGGDKINKKFLYYAILHELKIVNDLKHSTTVKHLLADDIDNLSVILPPLAIQQKIVDFLDRKCSEIDGLVADIQEQIEVLEQYKKSVITKAVTKGLVPGVPMKDSGIEWVGMIPEHWNIIPNKHIMKKKKVLCSKYHGEDILSLTMNGVIVRDLDAGGKMPASFDGYQVVYPNNLLMCLFDYDVTPRCIGLIKNYGLTSPAYSQFVMQNSNNEKYYYYYFLMIDNTKALLHLAKNLRHSFTEEQLGTISSPVPPTEEQANIAEFLDKVIAETDSVIALKEEQLETLAEYKKSLIYEYVTGKKEVPGE